MNRGEGLLLTPTYLIRQKTDFSWVKSLRPEPRADENDLSTVPSLSWAEESPGNESLGSGCS